jgi:hypothetical protein
LVLMDTYLFTRRDQACALPARPRSSRHAFAQTGAGRRARPPVVAFRIPRDLKGFNLETLESNYGIGHNSLFPEPEGLAKRSRE